MRFTMICIGSTGDVMPYVLLGNELQQRGHDVGICAFSEFQGLVESNHMRFFPLSGDAREFMSSIMKPGTRGVTYLKQVLESFREIIDPFLCDLQTACAEAEVIVATYFGNIIQSIAQQRNVPFIKTHYYPMDPNDSTPISSAPGLRAGKAWYRASYHLAYLIISTLELYYLTDWRKAQGMPPRRLESTPCNHINGHRIPVLYAMSPLLMPRPKNWDESIHMTGFWLDERASQYQPSPEMEAFLAREPKPVYIGFGSMTSGDMGETLHIVLEAIRMSGVRAIISTGWGHVELTEQENVFVAEGYVPHDWLFAHVSAVVHHGGAGTTAAGLCAGCPTLVIPFGGDQPFWALRVRMLGLGPTPIRREKLTAQRLARALKQLISVQSYRVAAQEMGVRLRTENGVRSAANIIEAEVSQWLAEDANPQKVKEKRRLTHLRGSARHIRGMREMQHTRGKRR
ncbi:MAG TPA: glycosyltransferase [Candidatus Limiplasma sp.]|nr:glycosyltransferase [Candidatus Limiplasma sp.]HPS81416.1 glycosyltransferase [Candidatus Limiplasma sp.]